MDTRKFPAQFAEHRGVGLDRNDFSAQRDQRCSQFPGSGAEIEHSRPGRGLERPAHGGFGVIRTVLGVRDGRCAERRAVKEAMVGFHAVTLFLPCRRCATGACDSAFLWHRIGK